MRGQPPRTAGEGAADNIARAHDVDRDAATPRLQEQALGDPLGLACIEPSEAENEALIRSEGECKPRPGTPPSLGSLP